jgi:hypothetical protein
VVDGHRGLLRRTFHFVRDDAEETFRLGLATADLLERRSIGLSTFDRVPENWTGCLGKILRYAHEMEVLASVPKIKLLARGQWREGRVVR